MRALSIFLAATALLSTVGTAQAAAGSTEPMRATAQQLDEVTGTYKLSDGRRAELYVLGTQLYVRIGQGQQKQLVMAGPNSFASRDGRIAIQFQAGDDANHIVLAHDRGIGAPSDAIRLASNGRAGRGGAD